VGDAIERVRPFVMMIVAGQHEIDAVLDEEGLDRLPHRDAGPV
jgi:hypothetical protein